MTEQHKATARRVVDEIFVGGKFEAIDVCFDPGYVRYECASPEPVRGPQGVKEQAQGYRTAFPDVQMTIEDQVAEGDRVVTRWTARGTHQGELFGIDPTGKQVTITGVTIDRFSGGKIAESWDTWDTFGLMQQLGVVPQMAQA